MFVSVVNFPIGGLIRHGFNLRPFSLGGRRVRSGEAGEVHHRVRGGECEVNINLITRYFTPTSNNEIVDLTSLR